MPCELGALMNLRVVGIQFVQLFYIVGMSDDFQAPYIQHLKPELSKALFIIATSSLTKVSICWFLIVQKELS